MIETFDILIWMLLTQVYSFVKIYTTVILRPVHSSVCKISLTLKIHTYMHSSMHTYIKLFSHPIQSPPPPYPYTCFKRESSLAFFFFSFFILLIILMILGLPLHPVYWEEKGVVYFLLRKGH